MTRRALTPLSYLDAPLDELLGQVSHVRILRVLSESEHPLPPGELARATRLNLSGVLRAIDRLTHLGIVRSLGAGGRRVIELSPVHAFAPVLRALFDAERRQRRLLLDALKALISTATPTPRAAWIEGPHASGEDSAHDALRLGVLTTARERHAVAEQLSGGIRDLERRFDLTVDLLVRTAADVETMTPEQQSAVREATLLYGVLPLAAPSPGDAPAATTHADLDTRSSARAERLAKAITRDPRLIADAQRWVQQRLQSASVAEAHELREWEHILTLPPHRIAAFLRDSGERATRLRQTTPFVGMKLGGGRGTHR
ncbi:MAG: helix-turn-helix domain-containing protein [Gemmatimonas sp.]|uniref:winged helix-turn-helix domain-containing protein n=1 Tax=Gemmatimonas sp. TaxID=1962908 RepID=UPI0025B8098D|nr:helix-turn-helix domain-containing protein [Gemmatimonas sp.]MCA2987906.1 helix-turn-helix domain-containing protein [Gemmatimonas sp.]